MLLLALCIFFECIHKRDRTGIQVRKTNLKIVRKARVGNDYLKLGSTVCLFVCLQLLSRDPPDHPVLSFPHQHRHPGDDVAEDIIIFKGQEPPQGNINIYNWLLMLL
jgi:hypothetical protein